LKGLTGSLINKIRSFVKNHRVVVAVSGGVDSMTLMHVVAKSLPRDQIVVAHFNHASRKESDRDESFVRKEAKKLGLVFKSEKLKKKPPKGQSKEDFWRQERLKYLRALMARMQASFFMTAHHRDDVIETFLFKLITGRTVAIPKEFDEDLKVYRPFLNIAKEDIQKLATFLSVKFVTDKSNLDLKFDRNFIRHTLLTKIVERFGQKSLDNLYFAATNLSNLQDVVTELIEFIFRFYPDLDKFSASKLAVDIKDLSNSVKVQIARMWLSKIAGKTFGYHHSNRFLDFLQKKRSSIQLPGGLQFNQ